MTKAGIFISILALIIGFVFGQGWERGETYEEIAFNSIVDFTRSYQDREIEIYYRENCEELLETAICPSIVIATEDDAIVWAVTDESE